MFSRTLFLIPLFLVSGSLALAAEEERLSPGAVARFGRTRFRAGAANHCLAVSPDGKVLATGGDALLRLWDCTGHELHSVELKGDHVRLICFSQ